MATAQLTDVLSRMQSAALFGGPFVVAGDFNLDSCPAGRVYQKHLNSLYSGDGWQETDSNGAISTRSTMSSTYRKACPSEYTGAYYKLDHILFKGYKVDAPGRVRPASVSDHSIYEGCLG